VTAKQGLQRLRPGKWTQAQFDAAIADFPKCGFELREALRSIMVVGQRQSEVAAGLGLTRQRVSQLVILLRARHVPEGWVTETVTLPITVMKQIRQLEKEARAQLEGGAD
jgi:TrfB plasmid transcriptional repressor